MWGRIAGLVGALLVACASVGLAEDSASVSVDIAKTDARVIAFGAEEGGASKVTVRLFKDKATGSKLLSRVRVPVRDDGSYRARFARPTRGECRVVTRTGDGPKDEESFPCYIPDFAEGGATLTPAEPLSPAIEIDALLAEDDRERAYGLMYRPRMPDGLGMAFLYEQDTQGAFWMRNTLIPLSIAFFDSNGVIVRILDMEPCADGEDCPLYDPGASYRGALEVNQGMFGQWGISEGDRIDVHR